MKTRIIYGLLAGLFFSLYWLTWSGAMLFVVILGAFLFVLLIKNRLCRRDYVGSAILIVIAIIICVKSFSTGIFSPFTGSTASATMELESFNILLATHSFSILTFLIPVILALLVYQVVKRGETSLILLLVWSAVILVLTVMHLRFAYYFAVNVALLTGWFIWFVWQRLAKQDTLRAIFAVGVLCAVALIPNIQQATASKSYHTPSDAWCDTLDWVKENTPEDSVILSWWDYGYWIEREADRRAYCNPSQAPVLVTKTAHFLLSPTDNITIGFNYLILDYAITTSKFRAVTIWAGEPIEKESPEYYQTLMVRLYEGGSVKQYELVYQSEQEIEGIPAVKVFRKVTDG